VVVASAVYFAGLIHYAQVRPIDGDEGFYTTAARLVSEGKAPYRDFFFQQAPLLPYLYSCIWAIQPHSLVAMRMFSATCGGLAVLLWGLGLASRRRLPAAVALATFAVVVLNPYWASWNVVVKTYATANLLMTVVMICLYLALDSKRGRWFFLAGLALGTCTSVRSLYGPLVPALAIWLLVREWGSSLAPDAAGPTPAVRTPRGNSPLRCAPKTAAFLGGAVLGLLPMIYSFARDPQAFIFNNVRYHHLDAGYLWMDGKFVTGYQSVGHTVLVYFANLVVGLLALHPYFTAELALAVVGILALRKTRGDVESGRSGAELLYLEAAVLMLAVYTLAALTPFPPYDQYFDSPLVPFMVPLVVEGLRVAFRSNRAWALALAVAAPLFFLVGIRHETAGTTSRPEWRFASYRQVVQTVKANSAPNDVVLSFWPGYVFESDRQYVPNLEDNFAYRVMTKIGPDERARFHVIDHEQVMAAISARAPALMVIPPWIVEYDVNLSPGQMQAFQIAVDSNYSLVRKIDDVEVYRRR
jgi:hypothetical protein